jgi:hypothetical protein
LRLAVEGDELSRRHEQEALHVSRLLPQVLDDFGTVPIPKSGAEFNHEYARRTNDADRRSSVPPQYPLERTAQREGLPTGGAGHRVRVT